MTEHPLDSASSATGARPSSLRLPHPVFRIRAGVLLLSALLVAGGIGLAGVVLPGGRLALVALTLVGSVGAAIALGVLFGRDTTPLTVRRDGDLVLGLDPGPLPAGRGRLVVERKVLRTGEGKGFHFALTFHEGDRAQTVFPQVSNPERLRVATEGLCRLGGWEMVWRDPEGDEVRTVDELDQPLVARLAAGRDGDDGHLVTGEAEVLPGITGGIELPTGRLGARQWLLGILLPLAAAGILEGVGDTTLPGGTLWQEVRLPLFLFVGFGILLFLGVRAISQPVTVDAAGVELRTEVLGVCLATRRLPVDTLESVYVEEGQLFHHLVFAGDGFHQRAGRFGRMTDAVAARRAVLQALRHG